MTCVCVYASRACACVLVYMCALQRAGMRAPGCGFGMCCVVCRVHVSCAVQKHLKVMHACILLQHSASLFIQLRTHMIHPCSPWVATSARAKFAGVGHVGLGEKQPTAVAPEGERKNCWWSTDNSCKGWSPTRRGPGRSSAGIASTPHFLDRLLPRFLTRQSEINFGGNVSLSV